MAQSPTGKYDQPILYGSWLLNLAKKKLYNHWLGGLGNGLRLAEVLALCAKQQSGFFYVHHSALAHLVNKPKLRGCVARSLLLFIVFNFSVVYKPKKSHGASNPLSQTNQSEPPIGIEDGNADATFICIEST